MESCNKCHLCTIEDEDAVECVQCGERFCYKTGVDCLYCGESFCIECFQGDIEEGKCKKCIWENK